MPLTTTTTQQWDERPKRKKHYRTTSSFSRISYEPTGQTTRIQTTMKTQKPNRKCVHDKQPRTVYHRPKPTLLDPEKFNSDAKDIR
jgi:hypothetical protein